MVRGVWSGVFGVVAWCGGRRRVILVLFSFNFTFLSRAGGRRDGLGASPCDDGLGSGCDSDDVWQQATQTWEPALNTVITRVDSSRGTGTFSYSRAEHVVGVAAGHEYIFHTAEHVVVVVAGHYCIFIRQRRRCTRLDFFSFSLRLGWWDRVGMEGGGRGNGGHRRLAGMGHA